MQELVAEELERRGFADLRPALLAVGQHVGASGTRITELAQRTLLTKATVVHAVDELERLGYVTREPDPTDGRAKLVVPTPRARAAERVARRAIAEIRAALGGADRRTRDGRTRGGPAAAAGSAVALDRLSPLG
jgi:DNA-binding MarR family transcriptional regulator